MVRNIVMVALTTVFLPLVWTQNYCSISKMHTMCQHKGTGPSCNGDVLRRGIDADDILEIMDSHNRLRAKIARGEETRGTPGPQPPAANMRILEWDDELAAVAQRHADQCEFAHDCSDCRRIERFGVGQNLYIYKQSLKIGENNWEKAITDWYDEVRLFSRNEVQPFKFGADIGHYSQMVWADTYKVGCGTTSYRDGKWYATLYTCNYGPNGNYIRGQMYEQGSACSSCPAAHSCSRDFPGLCTPDSSASVFTAPPLASSRPLVIFPASRPPVIVPEPQTPKPFTQIINRFQPVNEPAITTRRPAFRPPPPPPTITTTATTTSTTTATTTTTAEAPRKDIRISSGNSTIFFCDFEFESKPCKVRSAGVKWRKDRNSFGGVPNTFYSTELTSGDKTEIFFENLIVPPTGGIACLDFRYKKLSTGDSVPLTVMAWPFRGKPGRVEIVRDSPDLSTWIRAQITYRNIENYFLVMLKIAGPTNILSRMFLAIDDVTITEGKCDQ